MSIRAPFKRKRLIRSREIKTPANKREMCQRRNKILPLERSKSRPFWCARLGACGSHIASSFQGALAVRPILLGSFSGGGEACAALAEAVTFAVHLQDVDVMGQSVQKRAGQAAASLIRGHWQIENSLHWSLDVVMNDDQHRARKDHAPANFAALRRIAFEHN